VRLEPRLRVPPETELSDLLAELDGYVATLERYAREISFAAFVSSEDEQNKVLFGLHKAIQTSLDAAAVVIARRGLGATDSYRQLFERLATHGVLDRDLGDRMAGWAGLRNVIVHIYRVLDLERIHRAYASEASDLRDFAAALRRLPEARLDEAEG
jgi:uncharacterized protein YutE (UPF0331/DUF86 family)